MGACIEANAAASRIICTQFNSQVGQHYIRSTLVCQIVFLGLHTGEESPSWRLSAQMAADSVECRPRPSGPEVVPEPASLDRKPVDRLGPGFSTVWPSSV